MPKIEPFTSYDLAASQLVEWDTSFLTHLFLPSDPPTTTQKAVADFAHNLSTVRGYVTTAFKAHEEALLVLTSITLGRDGRERKKQLWENPGAMLGVKNQYDRFVSGLVAMPTYKGSPIGQMDSDLWDSALDISQKYNLELGDAVQVAAMRREGIKYIATTDGDFARIYDDPDLTVFLPPNAIWRVKQLAEGFRRLHQ